MSTIPCDLPQPPLYIVGQPRIARDPTINALQAPEQFSGFLEHVLNDWMSHPRDAQGPDTDPATATRTATLVIATIRGLLLDLLTTGDRVRIQDAAESFLIAHESNAPTGRDGIGLRRGVVRPGRGIMRR
jgi:hypothetical protein